jgi:hypothetical protein
MQQAAKTAITLAVMCVLLVVVGLWGWNAATEPFPGKTEPPLCVTTSVDAGEKVFPQQVTVSVYNASDRNGLAGRTLDLFSDDGFNRGVSGNAPRTVRVAKAQIWTPDPASPDVQLVAAKLGRGVEVVRREGIGVGVTVVVGDDFEKLSRGKKSVVAEDESDICSPPVS